MERIYEVEKDEIISHRFQQKIYIKCTLYCHGLSIILYIYILYRDALTLNWFQKDNVMVLFYVFITFKSPFEFKKDVGIISGVERMEMLA